MTEGSNEAVQLGGFSLKVIELNCNVDGLRTKRHDRERRNVSMTLVGPRYTRTRGNAVSTASEGQLAALELRAGTSLTNPGGFELGSGHRP